MQAVTLSQLIVVSFIVVIVNQAMTSIMLAHHDRRAYKRGYAAGVSQPEAVLMGIEIERLRQESKILASGGVPPVGEPHYGAENFRVVHRAGSVDEDGVDPAAD